MAQKNEPNGFVEIIQRAHSSTVILGICNLEKLENGQSNYTNIIARGSGFFTNKNGLLLTAKHVLPTC